MVLPNWVANDGKKYVYIGDNLREYKGGCALFTYLLHRQIYVDGFATDSVALIGLKIYHKEVVNIDALDRNNAIILYDSFMGHDQGGNIANIGFRARNIHPEIEKENVVIWGAGITGKYVWELLNENRINVLYFVDSNEKLAGTVKCGLQVYMPDILTEAEEDITVVEALEDWRQVDEILKEKYKKRFYFSLQSPSDQFTYTVDGDEKKLFELRNCLNFYLFEDKNIYIFGDGAAEKEFAKYLLLMDYNFCGFVLNEMDDTDEETCLGYPVKYVEEILYESSFYIWTYGREKAEKLEELGLKQYQDYMCHIEYIGISRGRIDQLDINLGHNYVVKDSKYPGIMVYGEEREDNYKIAVLGCSTTDGTMYPFKSWPELLYEKLNSDSLTIYNGGVRGYNSAQELFKLIRDILPLQPDMIIVYGGYNDIGLKAGYPFGFDYARRIFDYAKNYVKDPITGEIRDTVCLGSIPRSDAVENWLSNMRSMYAIAADRKIRFYGFCQPMLSGKEGKTVREKNMLASMSFNRLLKEVNVSFRQCMSQMANKPNYLYDLSHIFDGEDDVYMDCIHVWERGNRIIAEEIAKVILPELKMEGVCPKWE